MDWYVARDRNIALSKTFPAKKNKWNDHLVSLLLHLFEVVLKEGWADPKTWNAFRKKARDVALKIKRYPLWWWGWRGRWRRCSDHMLTWRRRRGWWTGSTGNCERGRNNVTVVLNEYFSDTTGLWECGWFYSSLTHLSTGHSRDLRRREHLIRHCVAKEGVCGTYNMATFRGM